MKTDMWSLAIDIWENKIRTSLRENRAQFLEEFIVEQLVTASLFILQFSHHDRYD